MVQPDFWSTVDGRNVVLVDVGSLYYDLQGFIRPWWWSPDFWTINSINPINLGYLESGPHKTQDLPVTNESVWDSRWWASILERVDTRDIMGSDLYILIDYKPSPFISRGGVINSELSLENWDTTLHRTFHMFLGISAWFRIIFMSWF